MSLQFDEIFDKIFQILISRIGDFIKKFPSKTCWNTLYLCSFLSFIICCIVRKMSMVSEKPVVLNHMQVSCHAS